MQTVVEVDSSAIDRRQAYPSIVCPPPLPADRYLGQFDQPPVDFNRLAMAADEDKLSTILEGTVQPPDTHV